MGFALLLTLFGLTANASLTHDCGQLTKSNQTYNWCVDAESASKNRDVLFAFHGAGDDETMWVSGFHGKRITQALANRISDLPTVISVSMGKWWLASDVTPANTDDLISSILPSLEARFAPNANRHFILGLSMGSYNASQLFFRAPTHFDKLVMMCAAIQTVGAFSDKTAIQSAIDAHSFIQPDNYRGFLEWQERTYQTLANWQRHNPLALIASASPDLPPVYVTVGRQDEFGFFDGAQDFASIGKRRGLNVTWKPVDGGHCGYDPDDIAKFLYP